QARPRGPGTAQCSYGFHRGKYHAPVSSVGATWDGRSILKTITETFRILEKMNTMPTRDSIAARSAAGRLLGKRSYRVRLARLGIDRLRAIARANGKKGGRPPKIAEVRREDL